MSNYANLQTGPQPIYHLCYRTILCTVDERYDIRGYVLAELVGACLKHRATLSVEQRAYFARYAQPEALAYLERLTANLLFGPKGRFSPEEYRYSQTEDLKPDSSIRSVPVSMRCWARSLRSTSNIPGPLLAEHHRKRT
ncbi:TPA: hypothetical protein ACJYA0_004421 [Pseudomonas aeruginosa]|uniref:hypothetical protein n=1 Tax=Pseudomonas aeruginosa TaxID=287 RepID=UPI0003BB2D95|nr:hypothetical protein [Pseudomonas aeruginosa]ERZ22870.1 hypothetical protein Q003_04649 [Pseudomonas aeruginosa CF27]